MPTSYTSDGERNGVVRMFTFARGQLPWKHSVHPDTTSSSRRPYVPAEGEELQEASDEYVERIQGYQAVQAVNTWQTAEEAQAGRFARTRQEAVRMLEAQLRDCSLTLSDSRLQRRRVRAKGNAQRWLAFLNTYDGCAQPLREMYGYESDTEESEEEEEAEEKKQPTRPVKATAAYVCSSPDLFCHETGAAAYPAEEDDVFIIPPTPVSAPRAKTTIDADSLRELLTAPIIQPAEEEEEEECIIISDEEEEDEGVGKSAAVSVADEEEGDEDVRVIMKHEEKEKARKTVRAAHLAVNGMAKLCEAEGFGLVTHNVRLTELRRRLASRKRAYEKAKDECERYEEELEEKRGRRAACREALTACLAQRRMAIVRTGSSTAWNFN